MRPACWHYWLIIREGRRRGEWKLRLLCGRCGKQRLAELEAGRLAVNLAWWRKAHPHSRA